MKRVLILIQLILTSFTISAQVDRDELVIAYYNTDNLFDTNDDNGSADDLFTASGEKFWGEKRYDDKLSALAEMISSIDKKGLPGIVVLSQIENRSVVEDLLATKRLKRAKYEIYMIDNLDGPKIALLALPDIVKSVDLSALEVNGINNDFTTSIIYATVLLEDNNTYHMFLNDWPNRSVEVGGSERDRISCAVTIRKEIDQILNFEREARIIVMGTFNDEPTNRSILSILNATNKRKNINFRDLYNPFYNLHNTENQGTLVINGTWQMYDYIILSPSLLRDGEGYSTGFNTGTISNPSGSEPVPTFRGDDYIGGASCHLPVFIKFTRRTSK